jgi:nucleotide-binding universal stress UspA family protein
LPARFAAMVQKGVPDYPGTHNERRVVPPIEGREKDDGDQQSPASGSTGSLGMKSILAVVRNSEATPVLDAALTAARAFTGRITGVTIPRLSDDIAFAGEVGIAMPTIPDRSLRDWAEHEAREARSLFENYLEKQGIRLAAAPPLPPTTEVTATWLATHRQPSASIGALGRLFDLIVVERPQKPVSLAEDTLEDALFESGRPVLMAPPKGPTEIGRRIVIAWNGSIETARTVAFAAPFLERAEAIVVLTIEGGITPGPTGEELTRALVDSGLPATYQYVVPKSMSVGETFLAEASARGADLLIKGAYTTSRLRQMIFGGFTRDIVLKAEVPVLLAH